MLRFALSVTSTPPSTPPQGRGSTVIQCGYAISTGAESCASGEMLPQDATPEAAQRHPQPKPNYAYREDGSDPYRGHTFTEAGTVTSPSLRCDARNP